MKNYAVYHCEKGSISSGGIGNHIDRIKGKEHTYRHADPERLHLNKHFELNHYCSLPLHEAINERIKDGYKTSKSIRKDAVKYTTHVLTGTHEKMKALEDIPQLFNQWIESNQRFLEEEFGKDNIVRFVLHMDEKTPHLHAVTVNLTSDGRLSAKEIIGNRKKLQARQDQYAELMKPYGLERGIRRTGIQHEDAKTYYSRMKASLETDEDDLKVNKTFLGVKKVLDVDNTINNYNRALKSLKTANKSYLLEIENLKHELENLNERKNHTIDGLQESGKTSLDFIRQGMHQKGYFEDMRARYIEEEVKNLVDQYKEVVFEQHQEHKDAFCMIYNNFKDLLQPEENKKELFKEIINENKHDVVSKLQQVFEHYRKRSEEEFCEKERLSEQKKIQKQKLKLGMNKGKNRGIRL